MKKSLKKHGAGKPKNVLSKKRSPKKKKKIVKKAVRKSTRGKRKPSDRNKKKKVTKKKHGKVLKKSIKKVKKKSKARPRKVIETKVTRPDATLTETSLEKFEAFEISNPAWQAVADFDHDNGKPITSAVCRMVVPDDPDAKTGQTIMIFIGLQSRQRIIQPILQWGRSQMGGGPHWTVGSCLASGPFGLEEQSSLIRVSPGQRLTAVIQLIGSAAGKFRYRCFFEDMPQTQIDTAGIEQLENCCVTLEARRISSRQHYPRQPITSVTNVIFRDRDRVVIPAWRLGGFSKRGEEARLNRFPGEPDQIDILFN